MDVRQHLAPVEPARWRIAVAHAQPLVAAGLVQVFGRWGHPLQPWHGGAPWPELLATDRSTAAELLAAGVPPCGVLVVEADWRAACARQLLAAGAVACLQVGCSLAHLAEALACAAAGRHYVCPVVAAVLVDEVGPVALTPRECDVLRLLCEGLDNKTIALRLGLALTTVKSHVKALLAKSGTGSRTQMAALALRSGWI